MIKNFAIVAIIASVLFASCKNEDEKAAGDTSAGTRAADPATETVDTVLSDETISFFDQSGFSDFARTKAPAFDWSKFRMTNSWKEDSLFITPFTPAPNYYSAYKDLLRYSPDSTMFIDLDSYNLSVEKDRDGKLIGIETGPDTEVSLINRKDQKKTRLVFLGPGNSIEEGSWIDNENLVLMGFYESNDTGGRLPAIWRYHIPTTTFSIYEMPDSAVASKLMGQWRRERLKGLKLIK
jgi:hypothetical protein